MLKDWGKMMSSSAVREMLRVLCLLNVSTSCLFLTFWPSWTFPNLQDQCKPRHYL